MKSIKVEGIVIRTMPYGEMHKIVTLLTKELGKIRVMAYGAKKSKGKLAGVTQLFTHGTFLITQGRTTTAMGTMKQGETLVRFRNIQQNLYKTSYASAIVELADYLAADNEVNESLFNLVSKSLELIEKGCDPQVICSIVEIKLLALAGIYPKLDGCPCCKGREGYFAFSIKESGFICNKCFKQDRYRMPVTLNTISMFCIMNSVNLNKLESVKVSERTKFEINKILNSLYCEYAGIQLKAKHFINSLEKPLPIVK